MTLSTDPSFTGRIWRYAPLLFWVGVIFILSSQAGAMSETSRFIGPLIHFFFPEMPFESRLVIHGLVRKSAHFIEYAVLAALAVRALSRSSISALRDKRYVAAVALAGIVAATDEFNQSFNPARTGVFTDVLLDLAGASFSAASLWLLDQRRKYKPKSAIDSEMP